jgi:predicted transport protein
LTLTGYNSEYSDRPFTEKRDMKGGFKESPLRLNEDLRLLDQWNEDAIRARAARLSEKALDVWPAPKLTADVLAAYKPKADPGAYTLQDHPYLVSGAMHGVFEAFRKEVLALDPCVSEDVFKTCIAYKAETNFVDLVPQMKRLQLMLNIKLSDIDDPKQLCEDVSEVGHLGYGDVRVTLTAIGGLPYVMGLVRQSFEKQMGNGSEA